MAYSVRIKTSVSPLNKSRNFASLASVCAQQIPTKEYLDSFQPRSLKKIKLFSDESQEFSVPPGDLSQHYHRKLDGCHSNPRSIIKIYREYIKKDDYPPYTFLIRTFCQLANTFGFNSFWSVRDKQVLHSIPHFKYLIYDLIERKHLIQAKDVPRMLYSMAALEYRSSFLLPTLLDILLDNIHQWRPETLGVMTLCVALLGIGDKSDNNVFTIEEPWRSQGEKGKLCKSRDYGFLVDKMCIELCNRDLSRMHHFTSFDWLAPAYAAVLMNLFILSNGIDYFISTCLQNACKMLSVEALQHSGWLQYYIYIILYTADVLKPANEVVIKKSVPFEMQKDLHLRWLQDIILHAQPQGSELLQSEVDAILTRKRSKHILINCSVGRDYDEQHCIFASHLIKNRNLVIEYDYLLPLGPDCPKISGWLQHKIRLFKAFGYNAAVIHKCIWDKLDNDQKEMQLEKLFWKFQPLNSEDDKVDDTEPRRFTDDESIRPMKHLKPKFDSWPPDKIPI